MDVFLKLITGGRKSQLTTIALALVTGLGLYKDVPMDTIMEHIQWILGIGVAGISVENTTKAFGKNGEAEKK